MRARSRPADAVLGWSPRIAPVQIAPSVNPVARGPARVDRRTKRLVIRLLPGDVAVIDHEDLDRVAAEELVRASPAAVVNASPSISGRYPNVGPLLLAAAGIPVLDAVGSDVLDRVEDGRVLEVRGGELRDAAGAVLASGTRQTLETLEGLYEAAKDRLGDELQRFAENTLEYLRREHRLVIDPAALPALAVNMKGRHVLIVVRGGDYRADLAHLAAYVREMRPVLIGVDGGADALIEQGMRPDVIIGDFDSVSTQALRSGAELVVHAYPGGRAPGAARLDGLGLRYSSFESPGTSEDVALLLAYQCQAALMVAVGTHGSMVEFLDKGRAGMASTFLVRLLVGQLLVDAKGMSRLYRSRIHKRDLLLFLLAAMLCFVVVALTVFPRVYFESAWLIVRDLWRSVTH
jgi:uncharacterized membrane-anchored protein